VRATPAFRADGEVTGPNGFLTERYTVTCTAADGALLETNHITVDRGQTVSMSLCTPGGVGGTVPATLSLSLGTPASFGPFTPGLAKTYTATQSANVISTAGDAALSVADSSPAATGHLVNGAFSLPAPLLVEGSPLPAVAKTYSGPVSNDPATITFTQAIGASDALRTGTYAKALTFTLSTTNP
jgi:hypothetical protein